MSPKFFNHSLLRDTGSLIPLLRMVSGVGLTRLNVSLPRAAIVDEQEVYLFEVQRNICKDCRDRLWGLTCKLLATHWFLEKRDQK